MPRKTWNVGDVLTSSDMNTYVRDQFIGRFTSSTRPTLIAGDNGSFIYETNTSRMLYWNGSAWTAMGPEPQFVGAQVLGATYNGTAQPQLRTGSTVVTTTAGGAISFGWGSVTNGILSLHIQAGDTTGGFGHIIPILANMAAMSSFNGVAYGYTGTALGSGVTGRVNWSYWCF